MRVPHDRVWVGLVPALLVLGCADEDRWTLPEPVAFGKYVDYGAWADVSTVCMDDKLAAWDSYIEEIADFMKIEPPVGGIRYTWAPQEDAEGPTWACDGAQGCARFPGGEYSAYVFTRPFEMLHEIVHAVEISALGHSHRILEEGMAEYLSSALITDYSQAGFSSGFEELFDQGSSEFSYPRAMHFVGALIERHGVEKYYEFRAMLGHHDNFAGFSAAYQQVYSESLSDALNAMKLMSVRGRFQPWGCDEAAQSLPWTTDELLDADVSGKCGDGVFHGGGFVAGYPGFSKTFTLDVAKDGVYALSVTGQTDSDPSVQITHCPTVEFGSITSSQTVARQGILWAGRHYVKVDYPPANEARGDVRIKLEFLVEAFR